MKILAIDTSAVAASAAIAQEDKLIGEFYVNTGITHSQTLMPMLDELLKTSKTDIKEIDAVAVNAGPGSFTGVRIGVAAAKGIAFPADIKCVSVSTLHSMAYNLLACDCVVCAVMDARCSQVYNALFRNTRGKVERLTEDRAMSIEELCEELKSYNERIILVGDGTSICYEFMKDKLSNVEPAPENIRYQKASSTAMAAFEKINNAQFVSCEELMPTYLRLPQAQRELNKKLGVAK